MVNVTLINETERLLRLPDVYALLRGDVQFAVRNAEGFVEFVSHEDVARGAYAVGRMDVGEIAFHIPFGAFLHPSVGVGAEVFAGLVESLRC